MHKGSLLVQLICASELGVLVVGRYCVAQGAVSDMVERVEVMVEDVMEVATKVVSLNTETEPALWEETLVRKCSTTRCTSTGKRWRTR